MHGSSRISPKSALLQIQKITCRRDTAIFAMAEDRKATRVLYAEDWYWMPVWCLVPVFGALLDKRKFIVACEEQVHGKDWIRLFSSSLSLDCYVLFDFRTTEILANFLSKGDGISQINWLRLALHEKICEIMWIFYIFFTHLNIQINTWLFKYCFYNKQKKTTGLNVIT